MRYSGWLLCLVVLFSVPVSAAPQENALFIYTDLDDNSELLYATFAPFYEKLSIVALSDVQEDELADASQLIVYSTQPVDTAKLDRYQGKLLVIGSIAQQMTQFQEWTFGEEVVIQQIEQNPLPHTIELPQIAVQDGVLVTAHGLKDSVPVIIKQEGRALINFNVIDESALYYISKHIGELLEIELAPVHPTFILLRDIHPQTDPQQLASIGNYLLDRGIPVYLNVTPTYLDISNEQSATLQSKNELLTTLQSLVERGAFIVAGGYTNYFKFEEAATGYEFWDIANNAAPYLQEQQEALYVQDKLIRTIHSFANAGLSPVAFAAPQYRMSPNGYKVSTYHYDLHIGQLQGRAPLFITKPNLLHGKTLFPDTLGLYSPTDYTFTKRFEQLSTVPNATISASYAVTDGLTHLKELVSLYDTLPNKKWLRLTDWPIRVQTEKVTITNVNNLLTLQNNISLWDEIQQLFTERPIEFMLWLIMIVTTIFVCLFSLYIVNMRLRYRKRLFEERDE